MTLKTVWIDRGREPQCPSDPLYPDGKDVDLSAGAAKTCSVALQHPTKRCGLWVVECPECGLSVAITTAGRPDDPRTVKVACGALGSTGEFPRGKLDEEDEGELTMALSVQEGVVRLDFGKMVSWLGLGPEDARRLGRALLQHADLAEKQ